MQASAWTALLRLIPAALRENLVLRTNNGTEVIIQGIMRLEPDYLVVRGRLTGMTEEGGGFFFIPYDQINYLTFHKMVREADVLGLFPGSEAEAAPAPAPTPLAADASDQTGLLTRPSELARPAAPAGKAALLERLRARRPTTDTNPPPGP